MDAVRWVGTVIAVLNCLELFGNYLSLKEKALQAVIAVVGLSALWALEAPWLGLVVLAVQLGWLGYRIFFRLRAHPKRR